MSDNNTNKVELLKREADKFESALRRYANINSDAEFVLQNISSLFDKIKQNAVTPPFLFEFGYHYFGTDGSLYKYPDLCGAAADFVAALEDWNSQPWFKSIADK